MSFIPSPDDNQLKEVIYHYKKFYLSFGIIVACIGLIVFFILPLIQQYADQQTKVKEVEDTIAVLRNNINIISAINEQDQTTQYQTAMSALPENKDFAGIMYSIKSASSKSNVEVGDFTFAVGELTTKSIITTKTPSISINLTVVGQPKDVSHFLTELSKTLPLSNVTEIHLSGKSVNLAVVFYYKPIPQLRVNFTQPFPVLSADHVALLTTMNEWRSSESLLDILSPSESSPSATPFSQ